MSESRAFANYSNVSRSLQQSAGATQESVSQTFADKLEDAKNFEQQFLIGMAVHQKAKVGDHLIKILLKVIFQACLKILLNQQVKNYRRVLNLCVMLKSKIKAI